MTLSLKIVVLGPVAVGKTSLINYELKKESDLMTESTISSDYIKVTETVDFNNQKKEVELCIWDTAGNQTYIDCARFFIRGAHAVIFVFDITSSQSFEELDNFFKIEETELIPIKCLCGNKFDLQEQRQVTPVQALNKQNSNHLVSYYETSAKDGTNVQNLFESIIHEYLSKQPGDYDSDGTVQLNPTGTPPKKKSCCK